MRYLRGHLMNAIHLPISKSLDSTGRLLSVENLERWVGAAGLDSQKTPLVYDGYDGRSASMLAWLLEYLGRSDVHIMDIFLEGWQAEGGEVFYRPVAPVARKFVAQVDPTVRASLQDVRSSSDVKLLDVRSEQEFAGQIDTDERPGHIPKAQNVTWQRFLGENHRFLLPLGELQQLLDVEHIGQQDQVVTYCKAGPRAAIAYLALKQVGIDVRLYDGSYLEWMQNQLPVESG